MVYLKKLIKKLNMLVYSLLLKTKINLIKKKQF